jgi:hypothetical protein
VTPVEDIVAHDDEAREDDGISPVKMMLSHTFIQWNSKISRPPPCPETLVPSDYSKK